MGPFESRQLPLSPEFSLVAACCRWPRSVRRDAAVRDAAAGVDWDRMLEVARRHRVEGLVHDGLAAAGIAAAPAVAADLTRAAGRIARDNLLFAAEAHRLDLCFTEAGILFLFVKGVTLNMLAYGTMALKQAADIDMVVDPAGYERAIDAAAAAGYRCIQPGPEPSRAQIIAWSKRTKHSIWTRAGLFLELHTAFVDSAQMLPEVSVASPRQRVALGGGITLPTLAKEELFAYLCVHGATHAWSRLKWLADAAAFVAGEEPEAIEHLYRCSIRLGAGRSAAQALLLARDLLGLPLPAGLEAELRRDRAVRWLVRVAKGAMAGSGARELDEMTFGTAAIHLSHFRLKRGWRFKLHELRRKLAREGGDGKGDGPTGLVASILAGPRWLARRARRAAAPR